MSVDETFLLDASCNGWKATFVSLHPGSLGSKCLTHKHELYPNV